MATQFESKSPPNLSEVEYRLCVRVAKLYYEHDLTQNEIAGRLGYSRVKINRVLRQAREAGILEVRINTPANFFFDLESELITKYNLRDVFIVMDETPDQSLHVSLARGAATWLQNHLQPGMCVGMGLGRTISHLPESFHPDKPIECTFIEIVGAASNYSQGISSYNVTSRMAELAGGKAEFFYAPTYVTDPELKQRLMQELPVKSSMEKARKADIVMQSIGPVDKSALLYLHKFIELDTLEELRKMGAVGDALGHYFDIHGKPVHSITDDRIIGLDLEDLLRIPLSVLIAGGTDKIVPIHAALKGKFFNVLVTDRITAQALLTTEDK